MNYKPCKPNPLQALVDWFLLTEFQYQMIIIKFSTSFEYFQYSVHSACNVNLNASYIILKLKRSIFTPAWLMTSDDRIYRFDCAIVHRIFMMRLLPMAYELITLWTLEPIPQQVHDKWCTLPLLNWDEFHRIFRFRLKFTAEMIDPHYEESQFTFCFWTFNDLVSHRIYLCCCKFSIEKALKLMHSDALNRVS